MQQIRPRDPVQHAPHLAIRVGRDVGRRGLADRPALEVEAQPVSRHPAGPPFARAHAPPFAEGAVVHVGAEREVPDLVRRPPSDFEPVQPVVELRQRP